MQTKSGNISVLPKEIEKDYNTYISNIKKNINRFISIWLSTRRNKEIY